jgi:hypothetical protein
MPQDYGCTVIAVYATSRNPRSSRLALLFTASLLRPSRLPPASSIPKRVQASASMSKSFLQHLKHRDEAEGRHRDTTKPPSQTSTNASRKNQNSTSSTLSTPSIRGREFLRTNLKDQRVLKDDRKSTKSKQPSKQQLLVVQQVQTSKAHKKILEEIEFASNNTDLFSHLEKKFTEQKLNLLDAFVQTGDNNSNIFHHLAGTPSKDSEGSCEISRKSKCPLVRKTLRPC